jgi:hypothetical protein
LAGSGVAASTFGMSMYQPSVCETIFVGSHAPGCGSRCITVRMRRAFWPNASLRSPRSTIDTVTLTTPGGRGGVAGAIAGASSGTITNEFAARLIWMLRF